MLRSNDLIMQILISKKQKMGRVVGKKWQSVLNAKFEIFAILRAGTRMEQFHFCIKSLYNLQI